jgi:hypothetical protein
MHVAHGGLLSRQSRLSPAPSDGADDFALLCWLPYAEMYRARAHGAISALANHDSHRFLQTDQRAPRVPGRRQATETHPRESRKSDGDGTTSPDYTPVVANVALTSEDESPNGSRR